MKRNITLDLALTLILMATHFCEPNMYYYYAPLEECLFTQSLIGNLG